MKTIKLTEVEIEILEQSLGMYINECGRCHDYERHKNYAGKIQLAYDIIDKLNS